MKTNKIFLNLTAKLFFAVYSCTLKEKNENNFSNIKKDNKETNDRNPLINDTTKNSKASYESKLLATKAFIPFEKQREAYKNGLTQYTKENCAKTQNIFDNLIKSLVDAGERANEKQKMELFKIAILKTNQLNNAIVGLIETGEREDYMN